MESTNQTHGNKLQKVLNQNQNNELWSNAARGLINCHEWVFIR